MITIQKSIRRFFLWLKESKKIYKNTASRIKGFIKRIHDFILKNPEKSFFALLGLMVILIIAGNLIRKPQTTQKSRDLAVKKVRTYTIGQAPKILLEGKIEKSGVITVAATTGGIVSRVNVTEGQTVSRGQLVTALAVNYSGAVAASISRSIAQANFDHIKDTHDLQLDIINSQRDAAKNTRGNMDKLRDIQNQSLEDTRSQLSLNQEILSSINENLSVLESATQSAQNESLILSTKQLKSQYVAAVTQIQNALRQSEYQSGSDNEPANLARTLEEITLKQLDLQEKSLKLNQETAKLNLALARVSESLYFPVSPISGVVERVFVRPGQLVNPGTPIAAITGKSKQVKLVAMTDGVTASHLSRLEATKVTTKNRILDLFPSHISTEPVNGQLYAVTYVIPEEDTASFREGQFVSMQATIGYPDTGSVTPYIPLDSVYITADEAYVFVLSEGSVKSRKVKTGPVFGSSIQIDSGLNPDDQIILDRNVLSGDKVEKTDL